MCLSLQPGVTSQLDKQETKVTRTCHICSILTKHMLCVSNKVSNCEWLRVWLFSVQTFSCSITTSSTSFVPRYILASRSFLASAGMIGHSACGLVSSCSSSYLDLCAGVMVHGTYWPFTGLPSDKSSWWAHWSFSLDRVALSPVKAPSFCVCHLAHKAFV